MAALDRFFVELVAANPGLRPRVGNPDELASNRLGGVLKALKHRVCAPESAMEAVDGKIITALNEEAVVSACLANQGGLNLVASYEAFCVKMLGAVRQIGVAGGDLGAGDGDAAGTLAHLVHHATERLVHGPQRSQQLAEFILTGGFDGRAHRTG